MYFTLWISEYIDILTSRGTLIFKLTLKILDNISVLMTLVKKNTDRFAKLTSAKWQVGYYYQLNIEAWSFKDI